MLPVRWKLSNNYTSANVDTVQKKNEESLTKNIIYILCYYHYTKYYSLLQGSNVF